MASDPPAPKGHSLLGMSSLERRFSCPGSMRMEADRPDVSSYYAQRGTNLHLVAAGCLEHGQDAIDTIPEDPDGAEIVQHYLDHIRGIVTATGGRLLIEQEFALSSLSPLFRGTADGIVIAPPVLHVMDLKTGGGHRVPVRRPDGRPNFQLDGYGFGALYSLPHDVIRSIDHIELHVIQPRLGPPQSTIMTIGEINDLAADMADLVEAAMLPDAPLIPGDHCTFCKAAADCPALRARAMEVAQMEFDIVDLTQPATVRPALPLAGELSPEQLARVLDAVDLVETWIDAVRARANALASDGVDIPGWKLVNKRARRIWVDEAKAVDALDMLSFDDLYTIKAISPAQAEKALKRNKVRPPKNWNDLVTMSKPGTTLAPVDDPRPAVTYDPGAEFEPVEQGNS